MSNRIEQNFNRTQSNLIEHNRSIEFDCVRQSNKIEHGTFCEFDYVWFCAESEQKYILGSICNTFRERLIRIMNTQPTISTGTFHEFQQNGKLFYSVFYLVTTDCKKSVTNDNWTFFLIFSFHDLIHHTSVRYLQILRLRTREASVGRQDEFSLQNLSRQFILTVQSKKVQKSNVRFCSIVSSNVT